MLLIFAQGVAVVKQIFEGTIWSIIFTCILTTGSTIFYLYLTIRPLISPEKFPDEREELNSPMIARWWNCYKHPLIASNIDDEDHPCKLN